MTRCKRGPWIVVDRDKYEREISIGFADPAQNVIQNSPASLHSYDDHLHYLMMSSITSLAEEDM